MSLNTTRIVKAISMIGSLIAGAVLIKQGQFEMGLGIITSAFSSATVFPNATDAVTQPQPSPTVGQSPRTTHTD